MTSLAWNDIELRHSLFRRIVECRSVEDSRSRNIPLRTFMFWLEKFTAAEKLTLSALHRGAAVRELDEWISHQRKHGGHSYLSYFQEQNLVALVLQKDQDNEPMIREQVLEAAQSIKSAASDKFEDLPTRTWFERFIEKNKSRLSFKKVQTKSAARLIAEQNPKAISAFIDQLRELVAKYGISPSEIIAGDETGFASRAKEDTKYIVAKGRNSSRLAERAILKHISLMHLCDGGGDSLPPMFMFKGERLDATAIKDAPANAVFQYQTKGYFESKHFIEILRHIVRCHPIPASCRVRKFSTDVLTKTDSDGVQHIETIESPVCHRILILDNAPSHHSAVATEYAENHWIHILYLPPNLTHIMQVSDVAVFAIMKRGWYRIENSRVVVHDAGFKFTPQSFWTFLKVSYENAVKPENVKRGFRQSGQSPVDDGPPLARLSKLKPGYELPTNPVFDQQLMVNTMNDSFRIKSRQLKQVQAENASLKARIAQLESSTAQTHSIELDLSLGESKSDDENSEIRNGWNGSNGILSVHLGTYQSPMSTPITTPSSSSLKQPSQFITRTNLLAPYQFISPTDASQAHSNQTQHLTPHKIDLSSVQSRPVTIQFHRSGIDALNHISVEELNEKLERLRQLSKAQGSRAKKTKTKTTAKSSNRRSKKSRGRSRRKQRPSREVTSSDSSTDESSREVKRAQKRSSRKRRHESEIELSSSEHEEQPTSRSSTKRSRADTTLDASTSDGHFSPVRQRKRRIGNATVQPVDHLSSEHQSNNQISHVAPMTQHQSGAENVASDVSLRTSLMSAVRAPVMTVSPLQSINPSAMFDLSTLIGQPRPAQSSLQSSQPSPVVPRSPPSKSLHLSMRLTFTPVSTTGSQSRPRSRPSFKIVSADETLIRLRRSCPVRKLRLP